jgi:uncharacterized protein (DUF2249 family)
VNTVVLASSEQEAEAVEAVVAHHAAMAGALATHSERLLGAHDNEQAADARDELVHWAVTELLPHAKAEERALYPLAAQLPEGRLLIESMLGEHEVIVGLVAQLRTADTAVRAAAVGTALRVMFDSHLGKENDLVLPVVAQAPGVSLAEALHGMHELLDEGAADDAHAGHHADGGHDHAHGGHEPASAAAGETGHGHSCGCGEVDGPELPELDARAVPHAIRHATIFGALDAVRPGGGLVLVAPHDPLPLLKQVEQRHPGMFAVDYLERGPEAWRLRFQRS